MNPLSSAVILADYRVAVKVLFSILRIFRVYQMLYWYIYIYAIPLYLFIDICIANK